MGAYSQVVTATQSTFNPVTDSFSFLAPASVATAHLTLTGVGAGTEGPKFTQVSLSETVAAVPEPQTCALLLAGLALVPVRARQRTGQKRS